MLRKETREFLQYWPQKISEDPEVQKIRKKYQKRNPSQIYIRAVRYANDIFKDLNFLFRHLPEEYLNQVDIEKGVRYLYLEESQAKSGNIRLRMALAQTIAGLHVLRQVLRDDTLLEKLYRNKLFEMEYVADLLYQISTGKMAIDSKSTKQNNRKLTSIFDEHKMKGIV